MTKRYLITGSPASGKTSVIIGLELRGEHVVREAAEDYIRYLQATGIKDIVIKDEEQRKLVDLIVQRENRILPDIERIFLDRSFPDALAYPHSPEMAKYVEELNHSHPFEMVFVMEPLQKYDGALYRLEEKDEAHELHKKLNGVYRSLGYGPIIVPTMSLDKRIEFILRNIREDKKR